MTLLKETRIIVLLLAAVVAFTVGYQYLGKSEESLLSYEEKISGEVKPGTSLPADTQRRELDPAFISDLEAAFAVLIDRDDEHSEYDLHLLIQEMTPSELEAYLEAIRRIKVESYRTRAEIALHYRWLEWDPDESLQHALETWDHEIADTWFDVLVRRYAELSPRESIAWLKRSSDPLVVSRFAKYASQATIGMAPHDLSFATETLSLIEDPELRSRSVAAIAYNMDRSEAERWRGRLERSDDRNSVSLQVASLLMEESPVEALDLLLELEQTSDPLREQLAAVGLQKLIESEPGLIEHYFSKFKFPPAEIGAFVQLMFQQMLSNDESSALSWAEELEADGLMDDATRFGIMHQLKQRHPQLAQVWRDRIQDPAVLEEPDR
ncbi:hypothetical protein IEN85_19090 [Pelagicoccus sp. NFK12]|uniref:Uncharacterized protein n=1 Tax=Pelagicoccus enzymogenes TaxID=2773457 RepID=A0A927FC28_9BACT|nr:hypothetical protein [Pelagicoccus enzymogenes]MBD5781615.1 hypothetical protein [Pelagicoccus enzymogenes]